MVETGCLLVGQISAANISAKAREEVENPKKLRSMAIPCFSVRGGGNDPVGASDGRPPHAGGGVDRPQRHAGHHLPGPVHGGQQRIGQIIDTPGTPRQTIILAFPRPACLHTNYTDELLQAGGERDWREVDVTASRLDSGAWHGRALLPGLQPNTGYQVSSPAQWERRKSLPYTLPDLRNRVDFIIPGSGVESEQ